MTAIETLERAISKLEQLRDESTPGPWVVRYDGDEPYEFDDEEDIPEEFQVGGGQWIENQGVYRSTDIVVELDGFSLPMAEARIAAANVALVGALSRTVEPMLAHMRLVLEAMRQRSTAECASADEMITLHLARAILGEENDHDQ